MANRKRRRRKRRETLRIPVILSAYTFYY